MSKPSSLTLTEGFTYNVNNLYNVLTTFTKKSDDAFGDNTTEKYFATEYPLISSSREVPVFPLITNFGPNDFITYEITVPDNFWLSQHSIFNLSPYFFSYAADNTITNVFASVDITIPLFEEFKIPGNKIKICFTSSKTVANDYKMKGYKIGKIPVEYLNRATFFVLFRVCSNQNNTYDINNFVKSIFFKSKDKTVKDNYTSKEIIASLPKTLPLNPKYQNNLVNFRKIVSYLNTNVCESSLTVQNFKYLSNVYNTNFAFNSFYDCLRVTPFAQVQGNNTGENYFNSNFIDLTTIKQKYLYILALNQAKMQIALTSNIQIYNAVNYKALPSGTIATSPSIPVMNSENYPYIKNNSLSLFSLIGLNVQNIIDQTGFNQILIIERSSYNPINFYQSSNNYKGKSYVLFGNELTEKNVAYLTKNYDISFTYPYN